MFLLFEFCRLFDIALPAASFWQLPLISLSENIGVGGEAMEERRTKRRQRTFKAGKIIFNQQRSVLDCTARDFTEEGACLVVGSSVGLPEKFELLIPIDKVKRVCRVIWRSSDRVGVKFVPDS
jgi:hypothetical protein